ncbi:hypothetical protein AB0B31_28280 [Catellatospora citrea]|uniref:hypothetical protein n=1 Tax=Catellatospora citrea TaxID=53366 RepID=UPI003405555B
MSKLRAALIGAGAGLASLMVFASSAQAVSITHITGDCGTSLVVGSTVRTTSGDGHIRLKYTNGLGLTNNVALKISPIRQPDGAAAWGTTTVGPSTGGTWYLASGLGSGIRFSLNFRADANPSPDNHWEGDLYY